MEFLILGIAGSVVAVLGAGLLVWGFSGPKRADPTAASRAFVLRLVGSSLGILGPVLIMVAVVASR